MEPCAMELFGTVILCMIISFQRRGQTAGFDPAKNGSGTQIKHVLGLAPGCTRRKEHQCLKWVHREPSGCLQPVSIWQPSGQISLRGHSPFSSQLHPKTLFEIAMVLSTNSDSFPSNSHVAATFSILLRFGESWNPTNCERFNADGSLMGRTNLDKSVW